MIIGKNTLTGSKSSGANTSNKLLYGTGQQAVLAANQRLIGAYIGWGGKTAQPTGNPTGEVGLYDVSGSDFTTAPKIFSVAYSFSNAALSGDQWIYIPLSVDLSAHAGKTLCPAIALPSSSNAFDVIIETVTGASRKNGSATQTTLQSTLATGSVTANTAWAVYFETEDIAPSVSVTSINGGSPIPAGKQNVGAVTTGFTALPDTITTDAAGLTCSNIGGTVNAPEFDISDRVDGAIYPKAGTIVEFTFDYDGIEIASGSEEVTANDDETIVAIASPLFSANTLANAILDQTGRTIDDNDEFYHTTYSDLVITPDTDWTVTAAGSFELWLYVSAGADAGKMYYYSVTIAEGGDVIIGGGLTTRGLTVSGPTVRGLTVTGL